MWFLQETAAPHDWTKEELQNLQSGLCRVEERLQMQQALEEKAHTTAIMFGVYNLLDYYASIPYIHNFFCMNRCQICRNLENEIQLTCKQDSHENCIQALQCEISDLDSKVDDIIDTKNGRGTEPWQDLKATIEACLKRCRLTHDRQQTLDNRVAELEKRVCDAETFSKRQSLLEDSMDCLKSKGSQTDAHLSKIEARVLKLEPLLAGQRKLTTVMERMERDISDLDQKMPDIASADDFQLNFAPKINEKLHHCQNQVKVLEGQVSSLKDALQNNSASETSQNTYKLDSPSSVATAAFAAVSESVDEKIHTDATSAQGLSGHLTGSKELLARRPRSASMPKSSTRQVFVPFKVPPHPEDDTSRRCTLQVEEELHKAKRSNAPPETRKRLLKEVLLRRLGILL